MQEPFKKLKRMALLLAILIAPSNRCSTATEVQVDYQPSSAMLSNPERGLYVQLNAKSEGKPLSSEHLKRLRLRGTTLVLRMYYLKQFRAKPLSAAQLELIERDFDTLRESGCKCILRFAYSSWIGDADAPPEVVAQHIDQLEPLLRDNADVIAVLQTGFIGPWGEMHNSTNGLDKPESVRAIVTRLLEVMPAGRSVQVRTPLLKQACVGTNMTLTRNEAFTPIPRARIGHYNDCFLADESDMGTYEDSQIESQKRNLGLDTRYVPMGGETCRLSQFATERNARSEFSRLHWSYLHSDYHPAVIEKWRKSKFLDEVARRLGYRLSLVNSRCDFESPRLGNLKLTLKFENTGWAAPINPRDVVVIARNNTETVVAETNAEYAVKLPVDPRYWLPGEPLEVTASIRIPATMPLGKYQLFLSLPDPEPRLHGRAEYAIRLANEGLWVPETGRHDLKQVFSVVPGMSEPAQETELTFEKVPDRE